MSYEVPGLDWSGERIVPAFRSIQHLDIYDIRTATRDFQLAVTTLAGIINRPQPRVYLIIGDDDLNWLRQVAGTIPQAMSLHNGNDVLNALIGAYRDAIKGIIVFDPALNDTVNIATMLAGQRDGIVVSPALVQNLQSAHQLQVLVDLRTYNWRTRLQAYQWAQQNLLGECSARLVAGLDPNNIAGLRSFLVATRAFIYWLDSRKYLPDFSSGLQSERGLMQQIYQAFQPGALHLGWFMDESSGVNLTSQAAIAVLASDLFVNLEVWTAVQPVSPINPVQIIENPTPANDKIYVSFTISDGDNLQYCQHRLSRLWNDSARGSLPIGWTLSPALLQAAPALAGYYIDTATFNDEIIAGPSGSGYMFPSHWPVEQMPRFLQLTGQLMQTMGMTTLEVLDTNDWQSSGIPIISLIGQTGMAFTDEDRQQVYVQRLAPFGVKGILSGAGLSKANWKNVDGVPVYNNLGLAGSVNKTVSLIKNAVASNAQRPLFLNVYILAWTMTPSDLKQVVQQLGDGYEIVLPRRLLAMLKSTGS